MTAQAFRNGFLFLVLLATAAATNALAGHPTSVNVSDLDGTDGFALRGGGITELSGTTIAGGLDLNADGIDDLVVGSPVAQGPDREEAAGVTYVVFGTTEGMPARTNLRNLDGTNGFRLFGRGEDLSAGIVANAGDFNDDGLDDLIIGTIDAGLAYVIFGSDAPFPAEIDLTTLDGSYGITIVGPSGSHCGSSVGGAGDLNGDGKDDVVLGAPYAAPGGRVNAGAAIVVYGRSNFPATVDIADLSPLTGLIVRGDTDGSILGMTADGAGDVNGDGVDDVILGAPGMDQGRGMSYVILGNVGGFAGPIEAADIDGTNGFAIRGIIAATGAGRVARAGDVNADGFDDVIIGMPGASPNGVPRAGRAFVVYGEQYPPALIQLADIDGSNGFALDGHLAESFLGMAIAGAGDVDGDGADDVLVGAAELNSPSPGQAYLVFGSTGARPRAIDLGTLDGTDGFAVISNPNLDLLGASVATAGDVNNDGLDDLFVGAILAGTLYQGESYVIYGTRSCFAGGVNLASGTPTDVLLVNGEAGERGRMTVAGGESISIDMMLPPAGGDGRFVVHANFGAPTEATFTDLPTGAGRVCFPLLLPSASPAAVWNNVGRHGRVGASHYFDGSAMPAPAPAPSNLLQLPSGDAVHLPVGTVVTLQGAMLDPGSAGTREASATNAVIVTIE